MNYFAINFKPCHSHAPTKSNKICQWSDGLRWRPTNPYSTWMVGRTGLRLSESILNLESRTDCADDKRIHTQPGRCNSVNCNIFVIEMQNKCERNKLTKPAMRIACQSMSNLAIATHQPNQIKFVYGWTDWRSANPFNLESRTDCADDKRIHT